MTRCPVCGGRVPTRAMPGHYLASHAGLAGTERSTDRDRGRRRQRIERSQRQGAHIE